MQKIVGPDVVKIGFAQAMKLKLISLDKSSGKVMRQAASVEDSTQTQLIQIKKTQSTDDPAFAALKKRTLVNSRFNCVFVF